MPKNRFFVPQPLRLGRLEVPHEEVQHIKVMRLNTGANLEVANGMGQLAEGTLVVVGRNEAHVDIIKVHPTIPPPAYSPCLMQAFPRLTHLDTIIEKSVELGVGEIWLFPGIRSEKLSLSESGHKRLNAIAVAAMKQCGRLYLPRIIVHPPILEWKMLPERTFYGSFDLGVPSWHNVLNSLDALSSAPYFLVGPEAGLSQDEIAHLKRLGGKGTSLHPNTLRTETAGPFAIGLAVHLKMS